MSTNTLTKKKSPAKTKPAAKSNKPAKRPELHTVTPHLVCAGAADAIEFYQKAFGAVEMMRLPGPQGKLMHASVRIGDSIVMPVDDMFWGARYGSIEDPFGHRRSMATQIRDMSAEEIKKAAAQMGRGR